MVATQIRLPSPYGVEGRHDEWLQVLDDAVGSLEEWESAWPAFVDSARGSAGLGREVLLELAERLADNLPYFHPLYAGHMLKPPHPIAWAAHALTALVNPNNQTREVGQATTEMELEVVDQIVAMLGFDAAVGHLTSSGTIANLEAMWIAREVHPDRAIACSRAAHYNYARIARLIGVRLVEVPCRADETIDPDALRTVLESEEVGTVVATLGTTGLGVVDPLGDIVEIAAEHGCRVHVDAAYGGFFALLAGSPPMVAPAPFRAIRRADSVTIDPHKHGLQPYGCGCIVHRDPGVLSFFHHDSPYTYADRDALHMGQIQLECSRAGASAAALWATLRALPLDRDRGLGPLLAACRGAAVDWATAIELSDVLRVVVPPQLDIVSFVVWPANRATVGASELSQWTLELIARGQTSEEPFYLTRYDLDAARAASLLPGLEVDADHVTIVRACVMKPEHDAWWPVLFHRISEAAQRIAEGQLPTQ